MWKFVKDRAKIKINLNRIHIHRRIAKAQNKKDNIKKMNKRNAIDVNEKKVC